MDGITNEQNATTKSKKITNEVISTAYRIFKSLVFAVLKAYLK